MKKAITSEHLVSAVSRLRKFSSVKERQRRKDILNLPTIVMILSLVSMVSR